MKFLVCSSDSTSRRNSPSTFSPRPRAPSTSTTRSRTVLPCMLTATAESLSKQMCKSTSRSMLSVLCKLLSPDNSRGRSSPSTLGSTHDPGGYCLAKQSNTLAASRSCEAGEATIGLPGFVLGALGAGFLFNHRTSGDPMGDTIVATAAAAVRTAAITPCGTTVAIAINATTTPIRSRMISERCQVRTI